MHWDTNRLRDGWRSLVPTSHYRYYIKGWKVAQMRPIEKKIEAVLITSTIVNNTNIFHRIVLDSSTHILETLKMDVNRPTKPPRDCDRGIGITMEYFDPTNTLEYCPNTYTKIIDCAICGKIR